MMKNFILVVCVVSLFLLTGCANLKIPFFEKTSQHSQNMGKSNPREQEALETNEYVDKGRIVNIQSLKEGKKRVGGIIGRRK